MSITQPKGISHHPYLVETLHMYHFSPREIACKIRGEIDGGMFAVTLSESEIYNHSTYDIIRMYIHDLRQFKYAIQVFLSTRFCYYNSEMRTIRVKRSSYIISILYYCSLPKTPVNARLIIHTIAII